MEGVLGISSLFSDNENIGGCSDQRNKYCLIFCRTGFDCVSVDTGWYANWGSAHGDSSLFVLLRSIKQLYEAVCTRACYILRDPTNVDFRNILGVMFIAVGVVKMVFPELNGNVKNLRDLWGDMCE